MNSCEVFEEGRCFGCIGLDERYNIDKIKKQCETYQEEIQFRSLGGKVNEK